jgi:tetratricopeptide (TPR) repeat protein
MPRQKSNHVDDPAEVGRRLRQAREQAGLSQRALAFSGCTAAYISRIESGGRIPSLQLLYELGRRVGVSAEYLARGTVGERSAWTPLVEAELALRLDEIDEARRLYRQALAGEGDGRLRSRALEGLGQIALREGRPEDAVAFFEDALHADGRAAVARPSLAESMAQAYMSLGQFAPALAILDPCVAEYERGDDRVLFVRLTCLLGFALVESGDLARAEQVAARAKNAARGITNPYTRARIYHSQARMLAEKGQVDAAERYERLTLDVLRATEESYAVAHALQGLAHICLEAGRSDEGLELLEEGLPLARAAGSVVEIAHFRVDLARALVAQGQVGPAARLAQEVTAELTQAQPRDAGRAYLTLAGVWEQLGEREHAKQLCELAIDGLETELPSRYLIAAYRQLAGLLKQENRTADALELLERAVAVQESVGVTLR